MAVLGPAGRPVVNLATMDADLRWLLGELKARGIRIAPGSEFDSSIKAVHWMLDVFAGRIEPEGHEAVSMLRKALGLDYLIKAIHQCQGSGSWPRIEERLQLLGAADISYLHVGRRSQERDMTWETLLGCWACSRCSKLQFDEKPDILAKHAGTLWGIAAKVVYTKTRRRLQETVVEGTKQIESSSAIFGVVAVNCSNLLDHERYFPPVASKRNTYGGFPRLEIPIAMLKEELLAIMAPIRQPAFAERLTTDLKTGMERAKTRAVLLVGQTVTTSGGPGNPVHALLTQTQWFKFRRTAGPEEHFLSILHDAAQRTYLERIP